MTSEPSPRLETTGDIADETAVAEVRRGNREMFEVLVRRYNERLFRVGMAYLRNRAQAEDAMQSAYVKAFLHLAQFQATAAFSTWLTRIMINECLALLRRAKTRDDAALSREWETQWPRTEEHHGARNLSLKEMKALLEKAVAGLPPRCRSVYMLREVQQLSTEETAASLGLSTANVKVALHRARELLKTRLLATAEGHELFAYPAELCGPMTTRVMRRVLATA
jgi:RNA polymerase sigma factor (sigma-70 family)